MRRFGNGPISIVCVARAASRLKRRGGERPQQLNQMRAAFGAAKPETNFTPPAGADFHTGQLLEIHRDVAAGRIRAFLCFGLSFMYQQIEIDGEAYPHVMHGLARLTYRVALVPLMYIRFGVYQMRFDIPQAVFALVADAFDGAGVDGFTGLVRR